MASTDDYLAKAEKWLGWCDKLIVELNAHADAAVLRMDDVERVFTHLLSTITTVHEALRSAANLKGLKQSWSRDLNEVRNLDPLLFYIWKARNSENHAALVKWHPQMHGIGLRLVNPDAALKVAGMTADQSFDEVITKVRHYIYEVTSEDEMFARVGSHYRPCEERLREAGVELILRDTLALNDFSFRENGKVTHVKAPLLHLGQRVAPAAQEAAEVAVRFYRNMLADLRRTAP
jgi:hypothetical protein